MSQSRSPSLDRKPIFDIVRRILKRGLRQAEVDQIDEAFDDALDPGDANTPLSNTSGISGRSAVSVPAVRRNRRVVGPSGIALIKRFEGCARLRTDGLVEAYPDPGTGGDPWTIGWGATGSGIGPGTVWTQSECDERLASDLKRYAADVVRVIGDASTSQSQFDALVSFHYNTGAIGRATLTRKHIAGDHNGAVREFARWNRAGGRVLKGLTRRRTAEAKLYSS